MPSVFESSGVGTNISSAVLTDDLTLTTTDPNQSGESSWLLTVEADLLVTSNVAITQGSDLPYCHLEITGMTDVAQEDWVCIGSAGSSQSQKHTWSALCRMTGPTATVNASIINGNNVVTSAVSISLRAVQLGVAPPATTPAAKVTVTPGSKLQVSREWGGR